jgi:hypothetical protein
MVRVIFGLIKGGLVGAAVGALAWKLGLGGGVAGYAIYGVVGFLVGIVCGKALWRQETLVTPILKGVFGFLIGMGLYWVAGKALGQFTLPFAARFGAPVAPLVNVPVLLAPLIGMLYGIFVELDDGERKAPIRTNEPS